MANAVGQVAPDAPDGIPRGPGQYLQLNETVIPPEDGMFDHELLKNREDSGHQSTYSLATADSIKYHLE